MKALVVKYDDTKDELYDRAVSYLEEWLVLNGLPVPVFRKTQYTPVAGWRSRPSLTGLYRNGVVDVSMTMTQNPGRGFSWTGYKSDRTVPGVLAHEVGHHVQSVLKLSGAAFRAAVAPERPITSYAPNDDERCAEAMRLFILNPDLLWKGRPKTYVWLMRKGISPPHTIAYQKVLLHAPDRFKLWATRWATK